MDKAKLGYVAAKDIDMGERARQTYAHIEELALNIKERGLINPIAVMSAGDKYKLLAGGRRLTACLVLKMENIPCHIYPTLDTYDQLCVEEAENLHREDLTYAEKVALTKKIHEMQIMKYGAAAKSSAGQSQLDTANLLGVSQSSVSKDIQLAHAIELIPALGQMKNKREAMKAFDRMKEDLIKEELALRAQARLGASNADVNKKFLVDSYVVADFFVGVHKIEKESFHVVELDPPYGIDLTNIKIDESGGTANYNEISATDYTKFIHDVLVECDRVLMPDGWILCWHGVQWASCIKEILESFGYYVPDPAMWVKEHGQTMQPECRLASTYEPFFYARKGHAVIHKRGRANTFVYKGVVASRKTHPTERPIDMIQDVLNTFCLPASRVFVPFLGSGNTLLALNNLGLSGMGFELSPEYKNSFILKVAEGKLGEFTSCKE